MSSTPYTRTDYRLTLGCREDDRRHTASLSGRDDGEILRRQRPPGREHIRLGTPHRCTWPGREADRDPLSRCTVHLQWSQTLGRRASPDRPSALSTGRGPCATRPDVSNDAGLYAPDGHQGTGGAQGPGLCSSPTAFAQYDGGGPESPGLSPA